MEYAAEETGHVEGFTQNSSRTPGHREGLVSQLGLASSVQLLFSIGTDGLSVLRTFNMQEVMKSEVVISRCKS